MIIEGDVVFEVDLLEIVWVWVFEMVISWWLCLFVVIVNMIIVVVS